MKTLLLILSLFTAFAGKSQTASTKTLTITQTVKGYVVMDSVAFKRHTDSVVARSRRIVSDSLRKFKTIDPVKGEVPTGAVDGVNKTFALAGIPLPNTLEITVGGKREYRFTLTATTIPRKITLVVAPREEVRVDYEKLTAQ